MRTRHDAISSEARLLYGACSTRLFAVLILVIVPLYISVTGGAKSMGQLLSQPDGPARSPS